MIETVDLEQQRMSASLPDAEVSAIRAIVQPSSASGYKSPRENFACFMFHGPCLGLGSTGGDLL